VLRAYLKFRGAKLRVTIDSKTISDEFLMLTACNGKWEGSMFKLAPHAKLTDGIINLLTIKKMPLLTILGYLPQLNGGLSSQMDGIQYYDCKSIEIISKNGIAIHVDGEQVGNSIHQLSISVEKKALNVVRPESNPQTTISLSRENENA
jgi:diacylglycerol kinase family enzyme